MIKLEGKLTHGLDCDGKIYYDFTVRPLTLIDELSAIEILEQDEKYKGYSQVRKTIVDTLAYWTRQVSFDQLAQDKLTIELLLNNLTSEDYQVILTALGDLNEKSLAAGRQNDTAATQDK